jgi:peptidoglycan/xylan/chitin deacetylase (PgdA/CDA1 family)
MYLEPSAGVAGDRVGMSMVTPISAAPQADTFAVVNFHGVGERVRPLDPGEDSVWLSEPQFREIVAGLSANARVQLTVDDGNASDVRLILPALLDAGLRATFFITADRVGMPGFVTTSDIASLRKSGMTIGFHGLSHTPWTELEPRELKRHLSEGRRQLEAAAGSPVTECACPFGRYSRRVLLQLRDAGFCRVYTSDLAAADERRWLVPRLSMRSHDTAAGVVEKVQSLLSGHPRSTRVKMWIKSHL